MNSNASLYEEKPNKDPISCMRMDDFEIYFRSSCYERKLFKTCEKFISMVKWIPLTKRFDIWVEALLLD